MSDGAKFWDALGNLISDTSASMSRLIGITYAPAGSTGSITDAGFGTGSPYCIAIRTNDGSPSIYDQGMVSPVIDFPPGTNTMTYNVASPADDHLLVYGVR